MIDSALELVGALGPALAGLLTVPILQGIKSVSGFVDRSHAVVKQVAAVVIAFGLTQLGALLGVVLPAELALFDGSSTEALVAAAIAFGVHAGQKARENEPARLR